MNISLRRCQILLVAAYVSFNIIAYAGAVGTGLLSGDFAGFRAPAEGVGLALLLADAVSYGLVLFPVFNAFRHIGLMPLRGRGQGTSPKKVHLLITTLLIFQLLFAISTGVGTAGTFAKTDNPLRFIIYIIPIDMVALIYFAATDNNRIYKANLAVYLVSSLTRGWSFGLIFLLAIAVARSNGIRVTLSRVLTSTALFAVITPIIMVLRFVVRGGSETSEISEILNYTEVVLDGQNLYLYILGFVTDRLQHFTSLAYILENRETIGNALAAREFRPFFFDGAFFGPLSDLFGYKAPLELNSWLTAHYHGLDVDAVAYNTHIGFIGWPILAPGLLPFYLCFVGGLGLCSVYVSRLIGGRSVVALTWLMWLLLLMNGWFGAFISYLVALVFFRLLQASVRRSDKRQPSQPARALPRIPGADSQTSSPPLHG